MLTPVSNETMALAAMIEALRAQTTAVLKTNEKMDALSSAVAKVREDIAVMKVRDEQMGDLMAIVGHLTKRLEAIELLHAQQAGAGKMMEVIRSWSPWITTLLIGIWALFERKPS